MRGLKNPTLLMGGSPRHPHWPSSVCLIKGALLEVSWQALPWSPRADASLGPLPAPPLMLPTRAVTGFGRLVWPRELAFRPEEQMFHQ